jgi:peptide deformylase
MTVFRKILFLVLAAGVSGCRSTDPDSFTLEETALIWQSDSIMRVLTVEDSLDNAVLRGRSRNFSAEALMSEDFARLSELMVATVTHPSQDGVGIAGPQVGLSRRVVAVQRFDKEGEPFEIYPNVSIVWMSDSLAYGPEGCLSVPDRRGEVLRSQEIIIEYADLETLKNSGEKIPMVRDTVRGFTAVIFQHETDHLDGVLYIDRLQ